MIDGLPKASRNIYAAKRNSMAYCEQSKSRSESPNLVHKYKFMLFLQALKFYSSYLACEGLTHSHTMTLLTPLGNKPFENTVGKGEIARNEQFLLYPQCFRPV